MACPTATITKVITTTTVATETVTATIIPKVKFLWFDMSLTGRDAFVILHIIIRPRQKHEYAMALVEVHRASMSGHPPGTEVTTTMIPYEVERPAQPNLRERLWRLIRGAPVAPLPKDAKVPRLFSTNISRQPNTSSSAPSNAGSEFPASSNPGRAAPANRSGDNPASSISGSGMDICLERMNETIQAI